MNDNTRPMVDPSNDKPPMMNPLIRPTWSSSSTWPTPHYDPPDLRSLSNEEEARRQSQLARNRQAAFKCRQKKKEWIARLQETVTKVTSENQTLQQQVMMLREEVLHLKTLLLTCQSSHRHILDQNSIV
ncbi:hypothetical protein BC941DRAFT_473167 [Chlamydoabsidia padenii]|nr:hypothetical protein BC941DRAFT_473167 [Chlamydoabsidia padenii]